MFDKKTIVSLLIGVVVGGAVMGLVDANRPKPIFSSASQGDVDINPPECQVLQDNFEQYAIHLQNGDKGYNWTTLNVLSNNHLQCVVSVYTAQFQLQQ